ncbi:MAG: hypothetical protein WC455_10335 [Dehalococcoidia bacterium]
MNKHQLKALRLLDYLMEHPEMRFWQAALILFCDNGFLGTAENPDGSGFRDLFYED